MRDFLSDLDENILIADGFDEAIIGYVNRCGSNPVALYDTHKCIQILVTRDNMSEEEAIEYFEYNVLGSYVGEYTPAFATLL